METGEVPNRGVGRLEAYWTGVLERVKKQSEACHSKEGAVAWCEDPLSRDDSAIDADKEQRFPLLKLEQLNDQQRPFADEILKVSSIGISGPFNMMLRSPVMGRRMFAMLDYLRFNTSVPRNLNEFAILIQARLWISQVAWTAHYPLALKAGLPQAIGRKAPGVHATGRSRRVRSLHGPCEGSRRKRRHIQKSPRTFQRPANRRSDHGQRRLHYLSHVEQYG